MSTVDADDALNGPDGWVANATYLLEKCPYTIRVREGGGPEDLIASLVVTFKNMEYKLKERGIR